MTKLILPPNDSALESALAEAMAPPADLAQLHQTLETRFSYPTDEELPFLLWEWGLQTVAHYLKDPRRALAEGRPWQKIRGTLAAGHMARGWLDVVAEHEQQVDKRFHLHLRTRATGELLAGIIDLSRLSSSARSRLYRITYQLDHRALVRGKGKRTHTIRANSSGIRFRPDWPVLSLLERMSLQAEADSVVMGSVSALLTSAVFRESHIRRGISIRPVKPTPAAPLGLSLSVGVPIVQAQSIIADHGQRVMPRAGARRAVTKRADWQAVRAPHRLIRGKHIKRAQSRRGDLLRQLPAYVSVSFVSKPIRQGDLVRLDFSSSVSPALASGCLVTADRPSPLVHVQAELTGSLDLNDAPLSGLPPSDRPLGHSPAILTHASTS